jgi:hypothetical protein
MIGNGQDDPLRNLKDPLHNTAPESSRDVFRRVSKELVGCPYEQVLDVAMNLIINSLRQKHSTRNMASVEFDELFGRTKGILMDQYDSFGRKKGIFPYDQHIMMDLFRDSDKFQRK